MKIILTNLLINAMNLIAKVNNGKWAEKHQVWHQADITGICDLVKKENTVLIMSLNSLTSNMQAKESQNYFWHMK